MGGAACGGNRVWEESRMHAQVGLFVDALEVGVPALVGALRYVVYLVGEAQDGCHVIEEFDVHVPVLKQLF